MGDEEEYRRPKFRGLKGLEGSRIFWHPCSVCGDVNAGHGVGVDFRRKKLGTWYCAEHLPKQYRRKKNGESE